MDRATHYDLVVILSIALGLQLTTLIAVGVVLARMQSRTQAMVAECDRLCRVIGAMVAQEAAKIRALIERR